MGGAAVGGGVPGFGSGATGVLQAGEWQAAVSYRYGAGETYLRGSDRAETGPVLSYRMHYLDMLAAYGLTEGITLDAGAGVFPQKLQRFPDYDVRGSGIAHIVLGLRYLLAAREQAGIDWTVGAHGRIPVDRPSANLPQHLNPSTGAVGGTVHTRLALDLSEGSAFLLFSQSADLHGENASEYRYGPSYTTTLGALVFLSERVMLLTEVRGMRRSRDHLYGSPVYDTGSTVLSIAPQVGFQAGDWTFAPYVEYPFFRHYDGHQLANDYSAGVNIIWTRSPND